MVYWINSLPLYWHPETYKGLKLRYVIFLLSKVWNNICTLYLVTLIKIEISFCSIRLGWFWSGVEKQNGHKYLYETSCKNLFTVSKAIYSRVYCAIYLDSLASETIEIFISKAKCQTNIRNNSHYYPLC